MDAQAPQPGMAERAIDTAADVSQTVSDVTAALKTAVERLSEAIATAREPGKPLSTLSRHYPGSAAGQPVGGVPVRGRGDAAAVECP